MIKLIKVSIPTEQKSGNIKIKLAKGSSGSLSSGTSSEELSNDELSPTKASGLTRSASRVSRFKSAKEFFERLSSAQNCHGSNQKVVQSELRSPRGNIASRYTATLQAKSASQVSLSNFQTSPSSPRSRQSLFGNLSSSTTIATSTTAATNKISSSPTKIQQILFGPAPIRSLSNFELSTSDSLTTKTYITTNEDSKSRLSSDAMGESASPLKTDMNSDNGDERVHPETIESQRIRVRRQDTSAELGDINPVLDNEDDEDSSSSYWNGSYTVDRDCPSFCELIPKGVVFKGDNVIVGNGSLLNKRNKQLKIKFDEADPQTYEYPSEVALLAEPESLPEMSWLSTKKEAPSLEAETITTTDNPSATNGKSHYSPLIGNRKSK